MRCDAEFNHQLSEFDVASQVCWFLLLPIKVHVSVKWISLKYDSDSELKAEKYELWSFYTGTHQSEIFLQHWVPIHFFFCQRKQHNHHEIESIPPLQQPFTPSNSLHHQMWNLSQLCKRVFSTNQRERENITYYAPLPQSQSPGIFQSIEESITANNASTWSPQEPTQIGRERITNIMHSNSMYLRST